MRDSKNKGVREGTPNTEEITKTNRAMCVLTDSICFFWTKETLEADTQGGKYAAPTANRRHF